MSEFKINGKVIFQDKPSKELKSLMDAIHNEEIEKYFKLRGTKLDSEMTDAEFTLTIRVQCRLREQQIRDRNSK